jgi:proline dehydrogenase
MLRSFFIYLSKAAWARRTIMGWGPAVRLSKRFVAGEKLTDAIQAVRALNEKGINATLDHLGEYTYSPEEARAATRDILEILDWIHQEKVRSGVSIKLSQIGLELSEDLAAENLLAILGKARTTGNFVRLDMEDSTTVDQTLALYRKMRMEHGFENVGVVIQSYLYRSEADVKALMEICAPIRLCKGAYKEPAEVAFPQKADVDSNFDKLTALLLDTALSRGCNAVSADGRFPPLPAIATHDEKRIQFARDYAARIGLEKNRFEFQMLNGIRRDLQDRLVKEGYPVRVYVPYGTQWYPYFMRRLAERPANVWFLVSNYFRN